MKDSIKKIVIVIPHFKGGGPLVLLQLCKLLSERGYDARVFYTPFDPWGNSLRHLFYFWRSWIMMILRFFLYPYVLKFLKHVLSKESKAEYENFLFEPIKKCRKQWHPFFCKKDSLIIYPERVYGNILNGKNVVRWLLYHYPYDNKPNAYGKNDLIIAFRAVFNNINLNPKGYTLCLNYFNRDLYRQYNFNSRQGNCYIIRKGINRQDLPTEFDGVILDKLSEEEKVRVLNECEYCFLYDLQSYYSTIAAVCGCIPINVLEPGKIKEDYYSKDELTTLYGVAKGNTLEEIAYAIKTRPMLLEQLQSIDMNNKKNIDDFLVLL